MSEREVARVRVHTVSRNYRITVTPEAMRFYRDFDHAPGDWFLEGEAPGVPAQLWREALHAHVFGLPYPKPPTVVCMSPHAARLLAASGVLDRLGGDGAA